MSKVINISKKSKLIPRISYNIYLFCKVISYISQKKKASSMVPYSVAYNLKLKKMIINIEIKLWFKNRFVFLHIPQCILNV